jgi:hypothetical protein
MSIKKGKRKQPVSPSPPPKSRRRKPSDGLFAVANAMESMQAVFQDTAPGQTTPQRQTAAIQALEDAGELSDGDFAEAVDLFQEKPSVATAYLAIKKPTARKVFLTKQMEKARHIQD